MGLQTIFCVNITTFLAAHFKPGSVINTNTHTSLVELEELQGSTAVVNRMTPLNIASPPAVILVF